MHTYKITCVLGIAVITFFESCAVRKYEAPQVDIPESFRTIADSSAGADITADSGIATIPYQEFFTDTTLVSLIDSGVARNLDLQIAIKQIEYAGQALTQAKWGNVPTVNLTVGQASITRSSDNSLNGALAGQFLGKSYVTDYSSALGISWEADIWGKIKSRKDAALAGFLQSQEAAKAVRTRLVSNIAQGYYNLLMLDEQLEVTRRSIALLDTSIRVTTFLRDAGNVSTLAVQQLEASREQAIALLPQLQQQLLVQENSLSILTGRVPGRINRTIHIANVNLHETLAAGIPANMVSERPDIRKAELAIRQSHAMVNTARASMYPGLNITAQGGLNSVEASDWFKVPGSLFGIAAGSLIQPILQNKRLKTQYEQSKISLEQSALQFKQSVLGALGEVSNALSQIEKLSEQEEHTSRQVDILGGAVKNSMVLFDNGGATYLEVLTAQNNKLQAELTLAGLQRERLSAEVLLYQSLGGGWKQK